jgi:hypothetical protein
VDGMLNLLAVELSPSLIGQRLQVPTRCFYTLLLA